MTLHAEEFTTSAELVTRANVLGLDETTIVSIVKTPGSFVLFYMA